MRITFEQVQAAYAKYPFIKPLRGGFLRPLCVRSNRQLTCACPLGILAIADGQPVTSENFSVWDWAVGKYGDYASDFWEGVDDRKKLPSNEVTLKNVTCGYYDGYHIARTLGL